MVTHTIAILVVSFVIAIVLNQEFKGRAFVRAIFFLPVILSSGVLIGLETDNTLMAGMQQMMAESSPFTLSESLMKMHLHIVERGVRVPKGPAGAAGAGRGKSGTRHAASQASAAFRCFLSGADLVIIKLILLSIFYWRKKKHYYVRSCTKTFFSS